MIGLSPPQLGSTLPISPTVSDFEDASRHDIRDVFKAQYLRASPTVSDFMVNDTSATLAPSDDETMSWPSKTSRLPIASGSNVTLEDIEGPVLYEAPVDAIPEDDNLLIPGETSLDPLENSASQDDVPVRVLDDFSIFDMSSNELVPIAGLLGLGYGSRKFGASGSVRAWIDQDQDELGDDDESDEDLENLERVKLSTILEFDIHSISEATGNPDSKIYIRTKYAWYILHMPTEEYRPDRHASYEEFLEKLSDVEGDSSAREEVLASLQMLGRVLTEADIQSEDVKAYVAANLPEMCDDYDIPINSVRLASEYLQLDLSDGEDFEPKSKSLPKSRSKRISTKSTLSDKEMEVLKHRNTTYVTPIVSQIMKNLFSVPLHFAEIPRIEDDPDVITEIDNVKTHHSDPTSMKWGQAEGNLYTSLNMDGVEYHAGDDVMVVPGDDEDQKRALISETDASQSPNSYANHLWFCKICYFFEKNVNGKRVKMFHGQWFIHGSKTILQETAHSKSLFLLNTCEDNPAASIFKKCNITMMGAGDVEQPDDGQPHANDFHCALAYDEKEASFTDLPSEEEMTKLLEHDTCIACALRKRGEQLDELVMTSDGYSRHGIHYHPNDFIYIRSRGRTTGLLDIAQIVMMEVEGRNFQLTVQMFERPSKPQNSKGGLPWDDRRLYLTDNEQIIYDIDLVDGMCFVRQLTDADEIDEWVTQDDHFYVNQIIDGRTGKPRDLDNRAVRKCDTCWRERRRKQEEQQKLLMRNGPIRCLELFSGAGGLGTGLDLSGFVETKYAVEFSPSAAATYAKNHPNATVYCQDSNKLLQQAYETGKGETPEPLLSGMDGKTRLPPMPRRGDVDMISGGPPCQSFSRANHNPVPDDVRSTLPGNMLGFVETYDPQYFLLENVAGLLTHRLMSTRSKHKRTLVGGIQGGMVKFIKRTLIALGYQVRCKVLQATQYGAPQSRRRVIFWGAKRGLTIPDYPVPMYASAKGMNRSTLPTGMLEPMSRSRDSEFMHHCAPLRAVSVDDAISDLPPFDWISPHKILPCTSKDKQAVRLRIEQGIPQFTATQAARMPLPGFPEGTEYLTEPQNRYQKWLRRGMGEDEVVEGHYTKFFTPSVVEATVAVPLKPGATHRDIPEALRPKHMQIETSKSFYGRLDGDGQFKCTMTNAAPNSKESWLLHPHVEQQKRIMSVRELARSQGFPDDYEFMSEDQSQNGQRLVVNQIRQIGNAVPVPFALCLGKSLGGALLKDWERDRERREREGSVVYLLDAGDFGVVAAARGEVAVYTGADADVGCDAWCALDPLEIWVRVGWEKDGDLPKLVP
ncbi:DNA (cytosine-5)-methyltransferase 1B [Termitomyces sp. J132]|nr:DNA (cytosine-5)-methyltransferase 1B [Termitomyces sp. J132]